MARRSNKSIAKVLTPSISSSPPPVNIAAKVHASSSLSHSLRNDNIDDAILDRKITLATEGFTTHKFCELILRDRNRLSKENALTISEYVIALKREMNPRLSYKRYTIQILSEISKAVGVEKQFIDMTREDVLCYLDKCRKPEGKDPLHKWIGTYNTKFVTISRFFKWLH